MNAFERIIGYSSIKQDLMKISDTLKNRFAYEKPSVTAPRGLLLCGELGTELSVAGENYRHVVYHEAGHAVVSEVLCPGSVTLVSVSNNGSDFGGYTGYFNGKSKTYLYREKSRIICALGGIAVTEQKFGLFDVGCNRDLDFAFNAVRDLVANDCVCGFHLHTSEYNSDQLQSEQEQAIFSEVERYYRKAKEILSLIMCRATERNRRTPCALSVFFAGFRLLGRI